MYFRELDDLFESCKEKGGRIEKLLEDNRELEEEVHRLDKELQRRDRDIEVNNDRN